MVAYRAQKGGQNRNKTFTFAACLRASCSVALPLHPPHAVRLALEPQFFVEARSIIGEATGVDLPFHLLTQNDLC